MKSVQLPNGGFPYHAGEEARPDATAWAIIALSAYAFDRESCNRGRAHLVSQQAKDGRLSISPAHSEASWPTPLAVLAWQESSQSHEAQSRATDYLIGLTGQHFPNPDPSISGHDTAIRGWPWTADTHSWVIPTGLAILALQQMGLGTHIRVVEGQHMLVDRQLPHGGWNYGNTFVFGKELHPLPESTGVALQALAGATPIHEVQQSLDYLLHELPHLRTPLSLGWALLGLGAWGLKPPNTEALALASLQRQERYGPYPLPSLALLLCAVKASQGLHSLFNASPREMHSPSTHASGARSFFR
ncbi:MAG: terpene cyclase/mutase family protein [Nitrospirota bacterium]|nr:terpene cyclase/mutase family protein [Nitrospirota bacterium]